MPEAFRPVRLSRRKKWLSAAAGQSNALHSKQSWRQSPAAHLQAAPSAFTHEARQLLRRGLAEVAGLPTAAVMLERAQGGGGGGGGGSGGGDGCEGLLVELHVRLRADMAAGERLTASLQVRSRQHFALRVCETPCV